MTKMIKQGIREPLADDLTEFQLGYSTSTRNLYTKHDNDIIRFFEHDDDFHHIQISMNGDLALTSSPSGPPPSGVTGAEKITNSTSIATLENADARYSRNIYIGDYQIKIFVSHSGQSLYHRVYLKLDKDASNKNIVFKSSYNTAGLNANFSPQPLNSLQTVADPLSKTIEPGTWRLLSHDNDYYWTDVLTLSLSDPDCQLTLKYAKTVTEVALVPLTTLVFPDGNLIFDLVLNRRIEPEMFSTNLRIL
jgi:hypothetical protein